MSQACAESHQLGSIHDCRVDDAQRRLVCCAVALLLLSTGRHLHSMPAVGSPCSNHSPVRAALSTKPTTSQSCCQMMGQTDRQTDARPLHRPCTASLHTLQAVSLRELVYTTKCHLLPFLHSGKETSHHVCNKYIN